MIKLFNINNFKVDTALFGNHLNGHYVQELEENFASYVGAKYACALNSATSAIFLSTLNKNALFNVPSIIPPVVVNAIINAGNKYQFIDNIDWVGSSYILHDFGDYKIIDSAQRVDRNQFLLEASNDDLMIFSFYPTKPVGSIDGGIVVSNCKDKIRYLKEASLNGMSYNENNWERNILFPGWKMYMNSFQAFIALQNLERFENKKERLQEVRNFYDKSFELNSNGHHLYRLNIENRDEFIKKMYDSGIMCGIHYNALHKHPVYFIEPQSLQKSELCDRKTVSIPYHEKLSKQDVEKIVQYVHKYAKFWRAQ